MEKAITIAIENGWKQPLFLEGYITKIGIRYASTDPLFWQALGKGLGWEPEEDIYTGEAERHWHLFIDHLAEGKDIESFFINLIP